MTRPKIRRPAYDFAAARPTFIDAWPQPWRDLAPPTEIIPMDRTEINALGSQIAGFRHWFSPDSGKSLLELAHRLDAAIERQGRSSFVRLASRSPKDSLYARRRGMRVRDGAQALALILEGSERCAADLRMALDYGSDMAVGVRKWIDFPPWAEVRCFMVDRRWVGASQLRGLGAQDLAMAAHQASAMLRPLHAAMQRISACAPIADAAIDMISIPFTGARRALLLDVNPLSRATDLAFFAPAGDFNHTLRFCPPGDQGLTAIPLPLLLHE